MSEKQRPTNEFPGLVPQPDKLGIPDTGAQVEIQTPEGPQSVQVVGYNTDLGTVKVTPVGAENKLVSSWDLPIDEFKKVSVPSSGEAETKTNSEEPRRIEVIEPESSSPEEEGWRPFDKPRTAHWITEKGAGRDDLSIVGTYGVGEDGKEYFRSSEGLTGIPADEVHFIDEQPNGDKQLEVLTSRLGAETEEKLELSEVQRNELALELQGKIKKRLEEEKNRPGHRDDKWIQKYLDSHEEFLRRSFINELDLSPDDRRDLAALVQRPESKLVAAIEEGQKKLPETVPAPKGDLAVNELVAVERNDGSGRMEQGWNVRSISIKNAEAFATLTKEDDTGETLTKELPVSKILSWKEQQDAGGKADSKRERKVVEEAADEGAGDIKADEDEAPKIPAPADPEAQARLERHFGVLDEDEQDFTAGREVKAFAIQTGKFEDGWKVGGSFYKEGRKYISLEKEGRTPKNVEESILETWQQENLLSKEENIALKRRVKGLGATAVRLFEDKVGAGIDYAFNKFDAFEKYALNRQQEKEEADKKKQREAEEKAAKEVAKRAEEKAAVDKRWREAFGRAEKVE